MFLFECIRMHIIGFFVISASFCPVFGLNSSVFVDRWPLFRNEKSSHLIHLQILTIFTTVGFGDMSAWTTGETLYADWAMHLGGEDGNGIGEK